MAAKIGWQSAAGAAAAVRVDEPEGRVKGRALPVASCLVLRNPYIYTGVTSVGTRHHCRWTQSPRRSCRSLKVGRRWERRRLRERRDGVQVVLPILMFVLFIPDHFVFVASIRVVRLGIVSLQTPHVEETWKGGWGKIRDRQGKEGKKRRWAVASLHSDDRPVLFISTTQRRISYIFNNDANSSDKETGRVGNNSGARDTFHGDF